MGPDPQMSTVIEHLTNDPSPATVAVLQCATCEVTWRDREGTPCWSCGKPGVVASPDRLVLD